MEIDGNSSAIVLNAEEAYEILVFEEPTSLRTNLETELKATFINLQTKPFVAVALREQIQLTKDTEAKNSLQQAGMDLMTECFTIQSLRRILASCLATQSTLKARLRISLSPELTPSLLRFYKSRVTEASSSTLVNADLIQLLGKYIAPGEFYQERIAQLEALLARLALTQEAPLLDDNTAAQASIAVVEDS